MTLARKTTLLLLLLGGIHLLPACGGGIAGDPTSKLEARRPHSRRARVPLPRAVETVLAERPAGEAGLEVPSTLTVDRDVEVMSRLTGILEEIKVDRGQTVSRGQILARLDNRDLDLEVESAEKSYRLAQAEFDRAKSLLEKQVVSPQEFDVRRYSSEKAEADWKRAQAELDKSFIRAPFDGVVTERYARIGQRVVEDGDTPVFRITALEPLLARFYLPEARLGLIHVGDRISLRTLGEPVRTGEGRIRWISSVVDAASGTFQVLAEVKRPRGDAYLRPGLSVTVHLSVDPGLGPLTVLRSALAEGGTLTPGVSTRLFVVEGGRAMLRTVRVGQVHDREAEILSGVSEGEMVIRSFPTDLADGEPVRVEAPR